MTNTTRRFKLEYTDSGENVQTIAELGQNTGALSIDRFVEFRRKNDPDILKVWLEGDDFGNTIPTRKSEFGTASNGTDEPEIRLKQYNPDTSSFDLINRFYAKNKGTINENGELALKLYSFMRFTGRQSVQTGTVTDTNSNGNVDVEDALNATLPNGYAADVPGSVMPPTVTGHTLDARREKGFHELTRDFKWAITFTGNLDGSNNALVKYEPEGFGGTVDTLVSNEQAGAYRIIAVDTTNEIFTVPGDVTNQLVVDQAILVNGSTENDGTYTITNLSYDGGNNETDITVSENVTNSTADGQIIPGGQAIFKSWEKDKTDAIINKVQVEGTKPSDSTEVNGTVRNEVQVDNFGEKFLKVKRGYIETKNEAQVIAKSYLVPGKEDFDIQAVDTTNDIFTVSGDQTDRTPANDNVVVTNSTGNDGVYTVSSSNYDSGNDETDITVSEDVSNGTADGQIALSITNIPESGTVKTSVYSDNVVNDSFQVVDNTRNIDDTYTVVEQRNYWPEGATELEFEFEKENLEGAARESENLRDERARLYPSSVTQENVGNQNLNVGEAKAQTSSSSNAGTEDADDAKAQTSTSVTINQIKAGDNIFGAFNSVNFTNAAVDDTDWSQPTTGAPATGTADASTNALSHHVTATITGSNNSNFSFWYAIEQQGSIVEHGYDTIDTTVDSNEIVGNPGDTYWQKDFLFSMEQFANDNTLEYDLHIYLDTGSANIDGNVQAAPVNHDHPNVATTTDSGHGANTAANQSNGAVHPINTDTTDSGHGDDQTDPHGGSTDEQNIEIESNQENKTDR